MRVVLKRAAFAVRGFPAVKLCRFHYERVVFSENFGVRGKALRKKLLYACVTCSLGDQAVAVENSPGVVIDHEDGCRAVLSQPFLHRCRLQREVFPSICPYLL